MITVALAILCGTLGADGETPALHSGKIGVDGFHCVVGDNEAWGEDHRAGYNGVFLMEMPDMCATPFVPAYAGLNLEHYFDLAPRNSDDNIFFEPRRAPMTFALLNEHTAELHQPTSPHYGVESWTRFEVTTPGRLDMHFRCVPHKAGLEGGVLGVFWASYINGPLDKSLYFLKAGASLDKPIWEQYATQQHNRDSTLISEDDSRELAFQSEHATLSGNRNASKIAELDVVDEIHSVSSFHGPPSVSHPRASISSSTSSESVLTLRRHT